MIERFNWHGAVFLASLVTAQLLTAAPPEAAPKTLPAVTLDLGKAVTVEVGKRIILTAKTSAKKVTWQVPPTVDVEHLDGKRLAVWANPGVYVFRAMIPDGDDVIAREVTLTVTGARPPPGPVPDPKPPTPDPTPKAVKVVVVVVEETRDRTAVQGKVLFDKGVRDWLAVGGHQIELLDQNDRVAKTNGYLPHAARVGLPAVLVFDAGMSGPQLPLLAFKLPATAEEWKAELSKAVRK